MGGIKRAEKAINEIADFQSFVVIGDPGCDGLGAEIMATFAKALSIEECGFRIVLGDIVPLGTESLYRNVTAFVDSLAAETVHMVCGNHDKEHYTKFFGLKNYMLVNGRSLIVVLDDSRRRFDDETVSFLDSCLKGYCRENIVLIFHIPPPNSISTNSLSAGEWEKLRKIILPFREKIRFIISGHVHSFFEDTIDGIKLVVTGGGGARLDSLGGAFDKRRTFHHVLRFFFDSEGKLSYRHLSLDGASYRRELGDERLKGYLSNAFQNECAAHVKYLLFAKDAEEKSLPGLAKLFRAAADAEFFHARNHLNALDGIKTAWENLQSSRERESYEIESMYKEYLDYASEKGWSLAMYSFHDAQEAEKIHHRLFSEAIAAGEGKDIEISRYFTCSSCGQTFKSDSAPLHCPVCGAPHDKIREVE